MFNCLESNNALRIKFRRLHSEVVNSVNPASIINILFQEGVIGADDMRTLHRFRDDPQQQCSELLTLLHTSGNPQTFVQLYAAIKKEPQLSWLIEHLNNFNRQSLIALLQQRYTSEHSGECVFLNAHGDKVQ